MCISKILSINKLIWLLTNIIWLTLLSKQVYGKPQDFFGKIANGAMMAIQQGAEIFGNGGVISKDHGFELPFAKLRSKTKVGAGEAMMQRQNSESSEEDRRKRSLEDNFIDDIIGEESLLPLQHTYFHHILKRSPCHTGTAGGGGVPAGGDDIDVAERRRRALARLRKAAAAKKKKAKSSTKTKSKKKYIVNDENPALTRRKRQSEQDDLNNGNKDFSQHAQQVASKIRSIWDSIVNSMNQMAQTIREKFSNNNSNSPASEEV